MNFSTDETSVARRNSITELCAAFEQSSADIKTAFALILEAQNRLQHFFAGDSCRFNTGERWDRSRRAGSFERINDFTYENRVPRDRRRARRQLWR